MGCFEANDKVHSASSVAKRTSILNDNNELTKNYNKNLISRWLWPITRLQTIEHMHQLWLLTRSSHVDTAKFKGRCYEIHVIFRVYQLLNAVEKKHTLKHWESLQDNVGPSYFDALLAAWSLHEMITSVSVSSSAYKMPCNDIFIFSFRFPW